MCTAVPTSLPRSPLLLAYLCSLIYSLVRAFSKTYLCISVHLRTCVWVPVVVRRRHKFPLLELELQAVGSYPVLVLGAKP